MSSHENIPYCFLFLILRQNGHGNRTKIQCSSSFLFQVSDQQQRDFVDRIEISVAIVINRAIDMSGKSGHNAKLEKGGSTCHLHKLKSKEHFYLLFSFIR